MDTEKKPLFTLSKANGDFIVQPFIGSGKGGQNRNKVMTACRITHPASKTISECQEERSFDQNKKKAFLRLLEKESFKKWYRIEYLKRTGEHAIMEAEVEKQMQPRNLKIDGILDDRWVELKEQEGEQNNGQANNDHLR